MNRPIFALSLFLFVWPTVTVLSVALDAAGIAWPIAAQTFLTSAILVPTMVYAVVPALTKSLTKQANAEHKAATASS